LFTHWAGEGHSIFVFLNSHVFKNVFYTGTFSNSFFILMNTLAGGAELLGCGIFESAVNFALILYFSLFSLFSFSYGK